LGHYLQFLFKSLFTLNVSIVVLRKSSDVRINGESLISLGLNLSSIDWAEEREKSAVSPLTLVLP